MTEELINEMYLLATKSKLQRGAISVEDRLAFILSELNLCADGTSQIEVSYVPVPAPSPSTKQVLITPSEPLSGPQLEQGPKVEELEIISHKYAEQPEDDGFINRELESDKELKHIYDIQLTNNSTIAYYELITDSGRCAEYMRSPSMVPEYVVVFDTPPISSDAQLVKVKSGVLNRCGKVWKIVEPCHMKWC